MKKVTSTTPPSFPKLSLDAEINEAMNEEAISTLKKMADFSIEGGTGSENSLFDSLIIEEPEEFHNRSFINHLHKLPWAEELLTQTIEKTVYRGKHMTFCRLHNDSLQTVSIKSIHYIIEGSTTNYPTRLVLVPTGLQTGIVDLT